MSAKCTRVVRAMITTNTALTAIATAKHPSDALIWLSSVAFFIQPAGDPNRGRHSIFSPVEPAYCQIVETIGSDDVIEAANNTRYGLAAYVFTNDLTVAWRMAEGLEAGIIGINDPVPATPQSPFGGMKESGLGRELGHEGLEAYLETKAVSFRLRD